MLGVGREGVIGGVAVPLLGQLPGLNLQQDYALAKALRRADGADGVILVDADQPRAGLPGVK
ncbi:MAG: hypothetical protein IPN01_23980 [Deltaproteobacteria bacterium]|nr:hypothetical protein [Deltaproteobacteria bacterium]